MKIDAQIIEKLRNRDEETFEKIYNEYFSLIYYIAYSIVKNHQDSEEVVQDTFLNMYNSIDSYKEENKFKQWLMQIARNLSYNKVTRNKEKDTIKDDEYITHVPSQSEGVDLLLTIKSVLNKEESNIVILKIIYNLTFKEISEECNMTVNKVQAIYYKALKQLLIEYKK